MTVSLILQKLSSYPRQPRLGQALREVGRLERTFFSLAWLQDATLRQRVFVGLQKGAGRNGLARAVFFHRLGKVGVFLRLSCEKAGYSVKIGTFGPGFGDFCP